MPQLHRACSLIALLALFSPAALHAQDNPRWYKVELLVFANLAAPGSEQWPATPVLDYPAVNRFLVYPERVREARENHGGPSELDQRGLLTLRPPPQPESETEQDTPDIPYLTDPNSVPPPAAEVEAPAPDIEEELPRPMPFVVLPAQQREFLGKAAYMERSGEFYTLFHQAWV